MRILRLVPTMSASRYSGASRGPPRSKRGGSYPKPRSIDVSGKQLVTQRDRPVVMRATGFYCERGETSSEQTPGPHHGFALHSCMHIRNEIPVKPSHFISFLWQRCGLM